VITDEIENNLRYFIQNLNMTGITLEVHPYIGAFLTKGFLSSTRLKWLMRYKKFVKIKTVNSLHFGEYRFLNASGEEIKV
jgi:ribonuclease G